MQIAAILPVFDETESVRALVAELHALIPDRLHQVLLVLAPRSSKQSFAVAEELCAAHRHTELYVQREVPGVGRAYREGYQLARGSHILMMDSDGEMQTETVPRLIAEMERTGADVVIASRWASGGGAIGYPPLKYFLNRGYQYLFRALLWTSLSDLTFGFKLLRREVVEAIEWTACFQDIGAESTMYPLCAGFKIAQVPTVWRGRAGVSQHSLSLSRNLLYVRAAGRALVLRDRLRKRRAEGSGEAAPRAEPSDQGQTPS
jgi:glycosyltransferase involved in cell wall biosynthesis